VLVAVLASRAPALIGNLDIDTTADIALDGPVFLFAAAVAILAGLASGLLPAWQAVRQDAIHGLREGGRTATVPRSQRRFRAALVVAEMALSTILLIAASLLIRSFAELRRVQPGLRADHLLTAGLSLPEARYSHREDLAVFARQVEERLRALPGVNSVGLVSCPPLGGYCSDQSFVIDGSPLPPGQFRIALWRAASPEYFAAAGIPLLRGRALDPRDGRGFDDRHPRESAVVISQSMARKFWPSNDPLGQRIRFGDDGAAYRVVGIVGDVLTDLDEYPRPTLYVPLLEGANNTFYAVLRTQADPAALANALRREIAGLDPDLPAYNVRTMAELLDESSAQRRFTMLLLASFAALALLLAAIGLYGVLSYSVAQRTNEIGIRLALGAAQSQLRRFILAEGLRPAILGAALGLAGAAATAPLLRSLLFGIRPADPASYLAVPALLVIVAAAACWLPASRATRIDPSETLRHE
jgi:putative ABC transport system permease protein